MSKGMSRLVIPTRWHAISVNPTHLYGVCQLGPVLSPLGHARGTQGWGHTHADKEEHALPQVAHLPTHMRGKSRSTH
jgi:hypothetical protein